MRRMHEIELKFQVEPAARAAVARAVATSTAQRTRLQAVYFDTAGRDLARAGIALRLRREGARWVQTLKAADTEMRRLEHEVPLASRSAQPPALDPALHDGHPAGLRLRAVLAEAGRTRAGAAGIGAAAGPTVGPAADASPAGDDGPVPLVERFRTDVQRWHRVQRVPGGAVELAYDVGVIIGGGSTVEICELEIEALRGPEGMVVAVARRWVDRFGLWLDVRSKAERGDRLARGIERVPAVVGEPPALTTIDDVQAARRQAVQAALSQLLPNAAEIAAGLHDEAHVRELRLGLQRLRSGLRLLRNPADIAEDPLDPALRRLSRGLDATHGLHEALRDLDPLLREAGAPVAGLAPQAEPDADPGALLRSRESARLWLDLLALVHGAPTPGAGAAAGAAGGEGAAVALRGSATAASVARALQRASARAARAGAGVGADAGATPETPAAAAGDASAGAGLIAQLRRRLRRLHREAAIGGASFLALDEAGRLRLRKRLRQLRDVVEFLGPLERSAERRRYLRRLQRLQAHLGRYGDLRLAETAYRERAGEEPLAWFAVGWLAARQPVTLDDCVEALDRLARRPPKLKARRLRKG